MMEYPSDGRSQVSQLIDNLCEEISRCWACSQGLQLVRDCIVINSCGHMMHEECFRLLIEEQRFQCGRCSAKVNIACVLNSLQVIAVQQTADDGRSSQTKRLPVFEEQIAEAVSEKLLEVNVLKRMLREANQRIIELEQLLAERLPSTSMLVTDAVAATINPAAIDVQVQPKSENEEEEEDERDQTTTVYDSPTRSIVTIRGDDSGNNSSKSSRVGPARRDPSGRINQERQLEMRFSFGRSNGSSSKNSRRNTPTQSSIRRTSLDENLLSPIRRLNKQQQQQRGTQSSNKSTLSTGSSQHQSAAVQVKSFDSPQKIREKIVEEEGSDIRKGTGSWQISSNRHNNSSSSKINNQLSSNKKQLNKDDTSKEKEQSQTRLTSFVASSSPKEPRSSSVRRRLSVGGYFETKEQSQPLLRGSTLSDASQRQYESNVFGEDKVKLNPKLNYRAHVLSEKNQLPSSWLKIPKFLQKRS